MAARLNARKNLAKHRVTMAMRRDAKIALSEFATVFSHMQSVRDRLFRIAYPHTGTKHGNAILRLAQLSERHSEDLKVGFITLSIEIAGLNNG